MSRATLLASLALLGLIPRLASAQALPFHTDTAITAGFQENAARAFAGVLDREGLVVDGEDVADPANRELDGTVLVAGAIPFSVTPLWTTRIVVPWIDRSLSFDGPNGRRLAFETSGVGDVLVDTKWVFFRRDRRGGTTRIGVQGGVELPVGDTDDRLPDGEVAPRPLQVGSGTWDVPGEVLFTDVRDRLGFHANLGGILRGEDDGVEPGDAFRYDAAVGWRLAPAVYESLRDQTLVGYLELNGEVVGRDRVDGRENPDSGGHLLFASADLQWVPTPWLLVEGSLQVPVVQDLDGAQLEHGPRAQLGARIRFSVFR